MDIDEVLAHHLLDHRLFFLFKVGSIPVYLTTHGLMMLIAIAILAAVLAAARLQSGNVRHGMANAVEAVIVYIRDEIVRPNLGPSGDKYLSYFLTLFFFILLLNVIGLVPFGSSATANITVTGSLALLTFILISFSGIREQGIVHYIKSFVPHGLPLILVPLIWFLEVLGLFTKALALCVRLFANMIAGHVAILVILSLIILFKSLWIAPVAIPTAVALSVMELFICVLQAYIFTLLTALFVGAAVNPQH